MPTVYKKVHKSATYYDSNHNKIPASLLTERQKCNAVTLRKKSKQKGAGASGGMMGPIGKNAPHLPKGYKMFNQPFVPAGVASPSILSTNPVMPNIATKGSGRKNVILSTNPVTPDLMVKGGLVIVPRINGLKRLQPVKNFIGAGPTGGRRKRGAGLSAGSISLPAHGIYTR